MSVLKEEGFTESRYDERFETGEKFLGVVPLSSHKVILVYRRKHLSRRYVRMRVWSLHKEKLVWYPTRRYFVVPLIAVELLGQLIYHGADMQPVTKPDWLKAHETANEPRRLQRTRPAS